MTTLLILVAVTIAAFVFQALFQQLGARGVGSKQATVGRAALVVVLTTFVGLLAQIALIPLATLGDVAAVVGSFLLMIVTLAATWAIIHRFVAISYGRAALRPCDRDPAAPGVIQPGPKQRCRE